MNTYQRQKSKARDLAIEWQHDFNNHNYSYLELVEFQCKFTKIAKKYGLVKEFRENGII